MKWTWSFIALAAVFIAGASSAAVNERGIDDWVQAIKDAADKFKEGIGGIGDKFKNWADSIKEKIKHVLGDVKNIRDKFVKRSEIARKCFENFGEELKAAINSDELGKDEEYANYVSGVINGTTNSTNDKEFQTTIERLKAQFRNGKQKLKKLIEHVATITKARSECYKKALREESSTASPNGNGETADANSVDSSTSADANSVDADTLAETTTPITV